MLALPLQIIDGFLFNYNVGDVLLLVVVLGSIGTLVQRSNKLFGIHLLTFGLLFMILPGSMFEPKPGSVFGAIAMYKFAGLALLVLAPVIFAVSRR